jgi:hypothetical protein
VSEEEYMKLETENIKGVDATVELIQELMSDDSWRAGFLIISHNDDDAKFVQITFDENTNAFALEYRDGDDKPLYYCNRPVYRAEAENALLDYLDGIETWKHRFEWEIEKDFGGSGGRSFFKKFSLFVVVLIAVLAVVAYVESGKVPRNMVIAAIVLPIIGLQFHSFTKSKPQKTLEDLDDDDGGIDWRETDAKDVVAETRDGWAVLMDNVAVYEAKAAAQALEDAHIRCRLDILSEDRSYHRYGNGGLGTRMCVLVAPEDYENAKKLAL